MTTYSTRAFKLVQCTRSIVNLDAARVVGLTLPADLIGKTEMLIGQDALAAGRNTMQSTSMAKSCA